MPHNSFLCLLLSILLCQSCSDSEVPMVNTNPDKGLSNQPNFCKMVSPRRTPNAACLASFQTQCMETYFESDATLEMQYQEECINDGDSVVESCTLPNKVISGACHEANSETDFRLRIFYDLSAQDEVSEKEGCEADGFSWVTCQVE